MQGVQSPGSVERIVLRVSDTHNDGSTIVHDEQNAAYDTRTVSTDND